MRDFSAGPPDRCSEGRTPGDAAGLSDGHESDPADGPAAGPVPRRALGLWEGHGVEIEMMIVDRESLDVRAVADRLFELQGWTPGGDDLVVEGVGWSNEVALHVLELKTPGPVPGLDDIAPLFQRSVDRANSVLEELGCRLLPGGMHPWMDPEKEFRIWPHEYTEVYQTFDRIFGCRGHGWSNLQSTHVNLPFSDDLEFGLLHEAVRLVLPVVPALAASSPVVEGRVGPALDSRMVAYRGHARQVPSVTGSVVPESVATEAGYRSRVLEPIYHDLAPVDPEGILRHEWVNARGAIARFGRGSVEIRVIDAQESPRMDVAVVGAVTAAVRRIAEFLEGDLGAEVLDAETPGSSTEELAALLDRTVRSGRRTKLEPSLRELYHRVLDLPVRPGSVEDVWQGFLESAPDGWNASAERDSHGRASAEKESESAESESDDWAESLGVILREGTLAERILADLGVGWPASSGEEIPRLRLRDTYRRLADTLARGGIFRPE